MQVPSGRVYDEVDLRVIRRMGKNGFVRWNEKPFTLNSGIQSHIYVFGREDMTDDPELEHMVGERLCDSIYLHTPEAEKRNPCLIGVPVAGNTLAQAAAMASLRVRQLPVSSYRPPAICHRVMRQQRKGHGAHQNWIDGRPDHDRHIYWLVDNVVTNGDSKIVAADRAQEDGYPSRQMACLIWIDRQQGAVPRLQAAGFERIIVVYNLLDITYAFVEMKLWPASAAVAVEEEIKAHQFLVEPRAQT